LGTLTGADYYAFSLPAIFPGEVVHYYIEAVVPGQPTTTLPAGMSPTHPDFGIIGTPDLYPRSFTVRALPSVKGVGPLDYPDMLWWDDGACLSDAVWMSAFRILGFPLGIDYDVFLSKDPTARDLATDVSLDMGLGAKANPTDLAAYQTILYRSADLKYDTITSSDAMLLDDFALDPAGKNLFVCGDRVVSGMLAEESPVTAAFVSSVLGVSHLNTSLRAETNLWDLSVVDPTGGYPGCSLRGSCPWKPCGVDRANYFDAVEAVLPATRKWYFNPPGSTSSFSAMTENFYGSGLSRILSMPYGLIFDPAKDAAPNSSRTELLKWVLDLFGHVPSDSPSTVPGASAGSAVTRVFPNYPNPFNPSTTIEFVNPASGLVELTIYDVQGRLVRTLLSGDLPAGPGRAVWDGTGDNGGNASSGAYFYVLKTRKGTDRGKMVILK